MGYDREGNYAIEVIDLTATATVTHGPTSSTVQLKPPVGFVYEIVDIGYTAPDPAGSAAGTHSLHCNYLGAFSDVFRILCTTGTALFISVSGFFGDSSETPATDPDQYRLMRKYLVASNAVPLEFVYTNSTDVDQVGTRTLIVVVKKYREAIL